MRKNGLMDGAIIATIAIILSKVMGVLYVIPFYAIIGESGGALYGYAYNIYTIFLVVSSAGIPLAISKLTSEYNTTGEIAKKEYMYTFSKKFILYFSFISFLICFFGSTFMANVIIGDITGGNTIEDVSYVIKCVSFAVLIVPLLSILRGYLQGHKFIKPSSYSQVIEQFVRILVIILGSFAAKEVFGLSTTISVGIAVFGAAVGAVFGYIYLLIKGKSISKKKSTEVLDEDSKKNVIKKLISYSIPFVVISLSYQLYNIIDMLITLRVLEFLEYSANDIELISSILSTWGSKLMSIITAIASGLVISLIPNMVSSYAKGDIKEVNSMYQKSLNLAFIFILPLSLFFSIYAKEVWTLFYGYNYYGFMAFRYLAILAFFDSLYIIMGCILQNLNKPKLIYMTIGIGIGINLVLDAPLMLLFNRLDVFPFYGTISSTLISYTIALLIVVSKLSHSDGVKYNFKEIRNNLLLTIGILVPSNYLFSLYTNMFDSRLTIILLLSFIGLISFIIYFIINKKVLISIFGKNVFKKVIRK